MHASLLAGAKVRIFFGFHKANCNPLGLISLDSDYLSAHLPVAGDEWSCDCCSKGILRRVMYGGVEIVFITLCRDMCAAHIHK